MKIRTILPTAAALALVALPLQAKDDPRVAFYKAKRVSTTRPAYFNARDGLRRVSVGMSESDFLATMQMEVLARKGKPYDARLDGFLLETTRKSSARRKPGERELVFGWVERGREVPRSHVVLRDHRVCEVRIEEETAAGTTPVQPD